MVDEEPTDEELELETLEGETLLVEADVIAEPIKVLNSPEYIASRQRAHDIKVAKFVAGGK